jgi:ABC-type sugar transport system ATPase subunit
MELEKQMDLEESKVEDFILEICNINKEFPGVKALNDVSIKIKRGEIHGLVGENGAGKSTLLKILSGVYQSDSGIIRLDQKEVTFSIPIDAQKHGICMEYQEKTSFRNLTVAENIIVGHWSEYSKNPKNPFVSWKNINNAAEEILHKINFVIDPKLMMNTLTPEKQQIVQIARAIAIKGEILILDEPTASISFSQVEKLFSVLRQLQNEGYTIIYVSHHLKEVFKITDRVTILKDGEVVGTYKTSDLNEREMSKLMVGRVINRSRKSQFKETNKVIFSVENLTTEDELLQDITFSLREGEILGVAGLLGSGKELLGKVIAGLLPIKSGSMVLDGKPFVPKTPKDTIRKGITTLPADRSIEGLVLARDLSFNITLSSFNKFSNYGIMNKQEENRLSTNSAKSVNLKYVKLQQPALSLSGGNQQRLMIARAFLTDAKVIFFNEPTQGVDVGAKQEIHQLIQNFASTGGSVVLISSELPELLTNTDRILVMSGGKITREKETVDATEEFLLEHMIG